MSIHPSIHQYEISSYAVLFNPVQVITSFQLSRIPSEYFLCTMISSMFLYLQECQLLRFIVSRYPTPDQVISFESNISLARLYQRHVLISIWLSLFTLDLDAIYLLSRLPSRVLHLTLLPSASLVITSERHAARRGKKKKLFLDRSCCTAHESIDSRWAQS